MLPVGCANLLVNGDFEGNEGWQFGTTPFAAGYDSSIQFDGQRSLRMGIPLSENNRLAHSSAFQLVTLPPDASEITLRYRQQPGGGGETSSCTKEGSEVNERRRNACCRPR